MIGVETQCQLVDKVNRRYGSLPTFHMISYNIYQEMRANELEGLLFPSSEKKDIPSYGLVGLHCCGDLSASLCRLFVDPSSSSKLLLFVGCCYNLLTTEEDGISSPGYPMNRDLVSISLSHRTRNAIVQVGLNLKAISRILSLIQSLHFAPV